MSKNWLTPEDPQWDLGAVMTRVRSGAMTPARAEEWAKAKGHDPFVPPTDNTASEFLAERYWPFALAMAWIATRDEAAAVRLWAGYKTWGARQFEIEEKFWKARDSLLKELRRGEMLAHGRELWNGPLVEVPVISWRNLRLVVPIGDRHGASTPPALEPRHRHEPSALLSQRVTALRTIESEKLVA